MLTTGSISSPAGDNSTAEFMTKSAATVISLNANQCQKLGNRTSAWLYAIKGAWFSLEDHFID